jgi:hypothetical protein
LTFKGEKAKTRVFRIYPTNFTPGGLGLVRANKSKALDRQYKAPEYSDFAYLGFDTNECGD